MNIKATVGAVLIGLFAETTTAFAVEPAEDSRNEPHSHFATEYGKTLPPIGFVQFCARLPEDVNCKPTGGKPDRLAMAPERWSLLHLVNNYVNGKIVPMSDQDLYGQPEYWAYPTDAGDCEDYVLLKQRYLLDLGFPQDALLMTVVLDDKNEGHAVLMVATEDGDYVLDNRRNEVRRWNDLDYRFLKRQSPGDPRVWAAIERAKTLPPAFVAGGNKK